MITPQLPNKTESFYKHIINGCICSLMVFVQKFNALYLRLYSTHYVFRDSELGKKLRMLTV